MFMILIDLVSQMFIEAGRSLTFGFDYKFDLPENNDVSRKYERQIFRS